MNDLHLDLIRELLDAAGQRGMPLWIGGGWAIDARLGRITREHEDIDLTFPDERKDEFIELIESLGGCLSESTEYGFLAELQGVLLDCEPACWNGQAYEIEDAPPNACPMQPEGKLAGLSMRCNSWDAILWDYFFYADETPPSRWPAKHTQSYALAVDAFGEENTARLRVVFDARHTPLSV